jgi:hypothetical protein
VAENEEPVTEQELRDALNRLQISDLLVQSLSTTSSLAFHRLAPESRDLDQAQLAIEALRALVPVLRDSVPAEVTRDFESVTANLQLAYAKAVEEEREPEAPPAADDGS